MGTDDVGDVLRRHDLRVTPQRRAILDAFVGTSEEHLSAEEVLLRATAAVHAIGRGTVYATLAELSELGILGSVGTAEPVRYETNVVPHDHFRCLLCLRLFDVDLGGEELRERGLTGFQIESVGIQAEGVCAACRAYERGLRSGAAEVKRRRSISPAMLSTLSCRCVESSVGALALAASSEGLVRIAFQDHADFDPLAARARSRRGPGSARRRLGEVGDALSGYFDGDRAPLAHVIDHPALGEAQIDALGAVRQIPYSAQRSYELISMRLSAYESGRLMGANPLPVVIPCHRVTRGTERPQIYVGGTERLTVLHALEAG